MSAMKHVLALAEERAAGGPVPSSQIGVRRSVEAVRRGWHVQWPDGSWRLVLRAWSRPRGGAFLVLAGSWLHDEDQAEYAPGARVDSRTPEEQILAVEAAHRVRAAGLATRRVGPVERLRRDDALLRALALVMGTEGRA